jgi:hypothetical protein
MFANHTMLTIGGFIILTTILTSFYGLMGNAGDDVRDAQDMILATTIATSYIEVAQGLAFDEITDTSNIALHNLAALTEPASLGPESSAEDSIQKFNDFDDFNRFVAERTATGTNRRYKTQFTVTYVNPNDVGQVTASKTFVKRLDTKTWRSFPPPAGTALDTLRLSFVLGYFHFD